MVLFHLESAALMSWLLYVPVGAMLREGSAGHERPAADGQNADGQRRFRPRPGWGAQQRPQPGEKADGGRRLRLGAQSGGRRSRSAPCRRGAECRKRGTAVGRQGALCARGWQRGAGGRRCGSRCGAAEDTDCCPASPRSDPARYPCAVCTTRTRRVQPGGALGAESCREKPSCDLFSGSRDAGR